MTTSKKKRRRVRWNRLIVLILLLCLVLGLVARGISILFSLGSKSESKEEDKTSQTVKKQSDKTVDTTAIEAVVKPDFITQETFDALKANALSGSSTAWQDSDLLTNINDYDEDILTFYLRDSDRYEFVKGWPIRDQYQTPPEALSESLQTVPAILQWDLRWGYQPYGDSMIYAVGCAPTCMSMVASYLNQDASLTPRVISDWADTNGEYGPGQGTLYSFFTDAASQYGLNVETIELDQAAIEQAITDGKVLIFHMLPGTFTTFGHFVVVGDVKDGQLVINDPNSIERSSHTWAMDDVLPETATIWAYSRA